MERRPVISVDVDLCVVNIDYLWWRWLNNITGYSKTFPPTNNLDYNLGNYFSEELEATGRDALDFFRSEGLYDWAHPINGSVPVLKLLSETCDIVFVSAVKGNHHGSKYRFLKRNFPFMKGFIATQEKQYVSCDYIIDDRHKFLNLFDNTEVKRIKFNTPYQQCEELKQTNKNFLGTAECWYDIKTIFDREGILNEQ